MSETDESRQLTEVEKGCLSLLVQYARILKRIVETAFNDYGVFVNEDLCVFYQDVREDFTTERWGLNPFSIMKGPN